MSVMWSTRSSSIRAIESGAGVSSPKPYIIGATVRRILPRSAKRLYAEQDGRNLQSLAKRPFRVILRCGGGLGCPAPCCPDMAVFLVVLSELSGAYWTPREREKRERKSR